MAMHQQSSSSTYSPGVSPPWRNYASGTMHVAVATGNTQPRCCDGSLPPSTAITCECQDLGNIDLREMTLGCITGTLRSGSGPMWGRISIRAEGDEISMLSLPGPHSDTCRADPSLPECNGEFCANLPMSFLDLDTEIEFVDPSGNTVSVLPDRSTVGEECGIGFCQQIGSPQPVCTQEFGCVSAGFTHEVIPESVRCPSERPFELRLDGSPTMGPMTVYRWDFELDPDWVAGLSDPSDAPEFVPGHFIGHNLETVSRCVEAGRYKVQLNAMARISPNFMLSNVERKTISIGLSYPGPCSVDTFAPDGTLTGTMVYTYSDGKLEMIEVQPLGDGVYVVEIFDAQERLVSMETDYGASGSSSYVVYNDYQYVDDAGCAALGLCGQIRERTTNTAVDDTSYGSVTTYEYTSTGVGSFTRTETTCMSSDLADCQGTPPEVIPFVTESELLFNAHGQLVQHIIPDYDTMIFEYVPGEIDAVPNLAIGVFSWARPRPRFWPLQRFSNTWSTVDFEYGEGVILLTFGSTNTDGSSSSNALDYSCW